MSTSMHIDARVCGIYEVRAHHVPVLSYLPLIILLHARVFFRQAPAASVVRRSLVTSMSTMEAGAPSDVLADLDELDAVMGVETQDQQDLKPKQVRYSR